MVSLEEFQKLLQSGSGRALLTIEEGASEAFAEAVWQACLVDMRIDRHCEDERSGYLFNLASRAGLRERLRNYILDETSTLKDELRDSFLAEYARLDDSECLETLRTRSLGGCWSASDGLMEVGDHTWVITNVVPFLSDDECWRIGMWLEECKNLNESDCRVLEQALSKFEPRCRLASEPKEPTSEDFEAVIRDIQSSSRINGSLRRIAPDLTIEQVMTVAKLWLDEREHLRGRSYAKVFDERPYPLPVSSIIELIRLGTEPVEFQYVLSWIDTPEVRAFAWELIESGDYRGFLAGASSWSSEDLPNMVNRLKEFEALAIDKLHSLCLEVITMRESWSPDESHGFLNWIFQNSPCSMCRWTAMRQMVEQNTFPEAHWQETEYDVDASI